ncbi:hypothetical protein M378DRAFT_113405 [Amanita muscaria Koide BX008]|uniref:Uncharacterized protein n=1 Tax=Amanita muscaria (strain Koide BX008) TaxID=946122 RepID=A0A0C2WK00_AMAMK|nr:hypothetical protein M378DRAFT_113405 [Amanita muscaria Koide BX008]
MEEITSLLWWHCNRVIQVVLLPIINLYRSWITMHVFVVQLWRTESPMYVHPNVIN